MSSIVYAYPPLPEKDGKGKIEEKEKKMRELGGKVRWNVTHFIEEL